MAEVAQHNFLGIDTLQEGQWNKAAQNVSNQFQKIHSIHPTFQNPSFSWSIFQSNSSEEINSI